MSPLAMTGIDVAFGVLVFLVLLAVASAGHAMGWRDRGRQPCRCARTRIVPLRGNQFVDRRTGRPDRRSTSPEPDPLWRAAGHAIRPDDRPAR